jgi:peroxiredoxin
MNTTELRQPVAPGEFAPNFQLPAVDGTGSVSLSDYRSRSAVFLALLVGLWCPFCRRALAQLANTDAELRAKGIETVGIVATSPENARLYFKFRPTRVRLGADPDLMTHRAYGVPRPERTAALTEAVATVRINPTGELQEPLPIGEAMRVLGELDGYRANATDSADFDRQFPQLKGQFLIDRDGVVRWANIECAKDGVAGVGRFPSTEEILHAAQTVNLVVS